MKREKRLTKREQKALRGPRPGATQQGHQHQHIHCIACGRHLDEDEFTPAHNTATILTCAHGSRFPSCTECADRSRELLAVHDRTNQPVQQAERWH